MNDMDKKIFEEYFYYGIDNIHELLEGIVYFATKEMHKMYSSLSEQYKVPNGVQLSQIKKIAYKYGIQYYRFIELNQKTNKFVSYKTEDELQNVKKEIDETINTAIDEKALMEYNIGYYYSPEEESKFSSSYQKGNQIRKYWTTEIVEQLEQLSIQEKENPIEYYKTWVDVRLKTAESRKQKNDSEIKLIQSVKKQLDERIKKYECSKEENDLTKE